MEERTVILNEVFEERPLYKQAEPMPEVKPSLIDFLFKHKGKIAIIGAITFILIMTWYIYTYLN